MKGSTWFCGVLPGSTGFWVLPGSAGFYRVQILQGSGGLRYFAYHVVTNRIGASVATHDVSGGRVGSWKNCVTIAA
jgi:hypothetical protein